MRPQTTETPARVMDDPWAPYVPDGNAPWSLRRVVHLHRRAGFAAPWDELRRDLVDGPGPSVGRLLQGRSRSQGIPSDFERTSGLLAEMALASREPGRLKGWWAYRMLCGPDPLTERLTLMWHDHFATSNHKVDDLVAMHRQNETFRELARAPFATLLGRVLHDPATLVWLDAPSNTREHPNENLARELMELFTLGIGNYTEDDVKGAARALSGWRLIDGEPRLIATRHDDGPVTILGRTGPCGADELATLLTEHPATSRRLAWRLCGVFFGEGTPDPAARERLAEGLRRHGLDIGWGVETILRSRAFFDEANLGTRVLTPAEFVIGSARALDMSDPSPSTPVLADWMGRLGQDLFYPPNVGGWAGGRAWITTRSAIGRANYAAALVGGTQVGLPGPLDVAALAARHGQGGDPRFLARLLLGTDAPEVPLDAAELSRHAVARLLSSPEAQRA